MNIAMRFFSITKKIGSVIILSLFAFSIFGTFAYAQTGVTCNEGVAGDNSSKYCSLTKIPGAFDPTTAVDPVAVIKNIYGISIGIGAMLAVVMIIWAGIEYATTESITGHSDAKEKWQGAVFGLVLLLASYIILRTINVDLVNINLDLGTPKSGGAVNANALNSILDAANATALAAQQAETKAVEAQKSLDALKTEKIALQTALATETDPVKKSVIQQKITDDEKKITDQEKVVVSTGNNQIVTSAINNQQSIITDQIKKIQDKQALELSLSKAVNQNYDISKDTLTQQQIISARQAFATLYSSNTVLIRAKDSTQVTTFSQSSLAQQQAFDNGIASIVGCPKGIIVTAVNVTCKN